MWMELQMSQAVCWAMTDVSDGRYNLSNFIGDVFSVFAVLLGISFSRGVASRVVLAHQSITSAESMPAFSKKTVLAI